MLFRIRILSLLYCFILHTVHSQYCSRKYQECSYWSSCCPGYNDVLLCLRATNYRYYCYPQSEYISYFVRQKTTPATSFVSTFPRTTTTTTTSTTLTTTTTPTTPTTSTTVATPTTSTSSTTTTTPTTSTTSTATTTSSTPQTSTTTPTTSTTLTTSATTSGNKWCAASYESCDSLRCCANLTKLQVCTKTPGGKFCIDHDMADLFG
ncbi:uncharacterized protein LOC106063638 isoform X2 [Biomphalaria glabrata]|uniref:Uncharacterized protein LOC106063638 isoform X2 n=1 Tax=Biomphalaria glabrata TaxID=6526 RepID=A0A9W2ZA27_BIOGL|nr:uncharacterized protein LOC106063638 isoform X2 [Biomphalaria glabrata]